MRKLRFAVVYALVWLPVALAMSLALRVSDRTPPQYALQAGFWSAVPAALLGLAVIALCRRVPRRSTSLVALAALHLVAGTAYGVLWTAAIVGEMALVVHARDLDAFIQYGAIWQVVMGMLTYAVIVGVTYARTAVRRQEEQERATERAETLRLRAELGALRARLDPHFLFNVLQTVGALIDERPDRAHAALELIAGLLKRRLDAFPADADDVTLAEELADVRAYLQLERMRLGDRVQVKEHIAPETLDLMVPRFTLQPLVENAIRHGLAPRAGPGRLTLSSSRNGRSWTLEVADDGVGADTPKLAATSGVGLSVLRERMRLVHGERGDVTVRTSAGTGCNVTLRLPAETETGETSVEPGA